jgi:DNA polymerase (family 10)
MHSDAPIQGNRSLAALLQSIADLLEARRENPHRIKAYRRGADTLLRLDEDVGTVAQRGALRELPGIGRDLAAKIEEFLKTGTIQAFERLKRPLPPEIAAWTRIPGLSETVVQHLYFKLGIHTMSDLELLVRSHLLRTLPGVAASDEELLAGIDAMKSTP